MINPKGKIAITQIDEDNEKAWKVNRTEPRLCLLMAKESLKNAEAINYVKGKMHAMAAIGAANVWLSNYDEALHYLFDAREYLKDEKNKIKEAQIVYQIFCSFYFLADYEKAISYANEVLNLADENKDMNAKANAYNALGTIYYTLHDHEKSIECLTLGYNIARHTDDKHLQARILDGLGTAYHLSKNIENAIKYKQMSLEAARASGVKNVESYALTGLALIHMEKGNLVLAEELLIKSLNLRREIAFKSGVAETLLHLGELYLLLDIDVKAKNALLEGLDIATETDAKENIYKLHESLARYYEKKKNIENFKKHLQLYFQFKEEYSNEKTRQKLKTSEMTARMAKMENERFALQKKNKELENLSHDLVLLSDIGKKITALLSVESINQTAFEVLRTMMDASGFGIGILTPDEKQISFPGYLEENEAPEEARYNITDSGRLAVHCFTNEKEILINDYDKEIHLYTNLETEPVIGKAVYSIIYVPLKFNEKCIGVITVQSLNRNAYSTYHLNLVKNLAVYCAIAIENARLYTSLEQKIAERTKQVTTQKEQLEKSVETARLLSSIGQEITLTTNFESIFRKLYNNVNRLMDAACFGVRIYKPECNEIEYRFEIEKGKVLDEVNVVSMNNNNNYSVWCVKNKEIIFINDNIAEHKKWVSEIHVVTGEMPHSLIFYPMVIGQKVLGVITVQSFQKNAYTAHHTEILKTLGNYASIALENANLVENLEERVTSRTKELEKQKEQLEKTFGDAKLISEIGKDITSSLSINSIASKVYHNINVLMDATIFGIGVVNPETDELLVKGAIEKGNPLPDFSYSITDKNKLAIHCLNYSKEIIINDFDFDITNYLDVVQQANIGEKPNSIIYLPLISKGKAIGTISVQSFSKNAYNEYDLNLLRNLALYTAIAIENAYRYENTEREVKERTKEIETAYENTRLLSQISKAIASEITIEGIIAKVYSNLNRLMDATSFGIGIYKEENRTIYLPGFIEKNETLAPMEFSIDEERLACWVIKNKKEIFTINYQVDYINYISGIKTPIAGKNSLSIIYVPLFLKDKILGFITVQSYNVNAYTEYQFNIVNNLAQSIASALENARLYENMEEKVKERTAEVVLQKEQIEKNAKNTKLISEVGKEISSLLDVSEIIAKVYERINTLMDADAFGIGIYRHETNDLFHTGVMESGSRLNDFSFSLNEESIAMICFTQLREIIINNFPFEYQNYIKNDKTAKEGGAPVSMIYMPLLSKGKTIGVMSVQSFRTNAYSSYHQDILRSLSVYIGSALDNAALYHTLEDRVEARTAEIEKAYQNTRLLSQISKEISSSLSLEHIVKIVYDNVNNLMDAASFGIGVYDPATRMLNFPGFIEKGERLEFTFHVDDDRLAGWCFRNKAEIFTSDYTKEYHKYVKGIKAVVAGRHSKSIIYLPLFNKENIIGVLTIQSYEENAYSEYHMDILRGLSHSIAVALDNATLYGHLEEKVRERTAEVVKQKEIIQEKNKHITDSIIYAKRIQTAILPPEEVFSNYLQNSFVLYKPKDIVSGDFYWIERKEKKILFAVVDCTGHGVPGAFMSIIGFNGLNQVVNEYQITKPDEILNELNKIITHTLRQREEDQKIRDGMDISICCIDLENNKLEFAGANNPIFIVRKGIVKEITADKHPIGNYIGEDEFKFTNHEIDLMPNDSLYLSSDGYADQFGGPRGKKLKYTQFRDLLLVNHDKPMKIQKLMLDNMFEEWRGELEQIDDVCVIGIRI